MKVFLAGTKNNSTWRESIIPRLKVDYFDPVIDNMDEDAFEKIIHEREHCDFCLYVITPKMKGFFAIPEVVDDSNRRPEKTLFCFIKKDEEAVFSKHQIKSLNAIGKMITTNGAKWLNSLDATVDFLNSQENS